MSIRTTLGDELRRFVDLPDGISAENMTHAPTISRLLGHGNGEQAHLVLMGMRRRSEDRDVLAAFAHMGVNSSGSNAEQRMSDFAEAWHHQDEPHRQSVSTRTVRRWSEAGIHKLTDAIIDSSGLEPPSMQLDVLAKGGSRFVVLPSLFWMHGYEMGPPDWLIVGKDEHAHGRFSLEDLEEVSPQFWQPHTAVEFDVGVPALIRMAWLGETQPTFQVRTINVRQDLVTMITMTPGGVGLVLYREGDDIDALADTAEQLGEYLREEEGEGSNG